MFSHRRFSKYVQLSLAVTTVTLGLFIVTGYIQKSKSANLISVSDTLSTSRLSWVAREGAGNSVGSSLVNIDTTQGAYESTSSGNLFVNDSVAIGNGGAMSTYTVTSISSASQFSVNPVLAAGQASAGDFMIATRSATHTLAFTTASAIANGAFRVLIPAVSNATNAKDGIPDRNGFDFSTTTPTVTCPTNVGTYAFASGTATASAVTIGSQVYHAFECRYSGSGANSQAFTGFTINSLINPAANANHVDGTADTYLYVIQNLDNAHNVIDQTVGSLAVVESVRVTATVDPQITFRIGGVTSGTSACGLTTNVTTTSTVVPFGSLSISSFTVAAQYLSVSTNAVNGYVVTGIESDQLAKGGATCTGTGSGNASCITDSIGDNGLMTSSVTAPWTSTAVSGFGYTLADPNSSTTPAFTFASGYRQFADLQNSGTPQTLFSGATVVNNANVYVCYKAAVSASQAAGDYTNNLTYRATATF